MTFTRKHFEAVADLLDANMANEAIVLDFADMFAQDNPRFDASKFIPRATNMLRLNNMATEKRLDNYVARRR